MTHFLSAAERLIEQGGIYIKEQQIKRVDEKITIADLGGSNELRVRKEKENI